MTDAGGTETTYVLTTVQVRASIERLLARQTHTYFPAYLHLRQLAGRAERLTGLAPNWAEVGEVLQVRGGPPGKPYLRPFWRGARDHQQEWLGSNLAGSWSASSLRANQAPLQVVETDADGRFNLPEGHWERAIVHLLSGVPMSVTALAGFLFRDRGFIAVNEPAVADLVATFRREYGYGPDDDEEFNVLYEIDWQGVPDVPWFVVVEASGTAG